jgi:hypothetical protein
MTRIRPLVLAATASLLPSLLLAASSSAAEPVPSAQLLILQPSDVPNLNPAESRALTPANLNALAKSAGGSAALLRPLGFESGYARTYKSFSAKRGGIEVAAFVLVLRSPAMARRGLSVFTCHGFGAALRPVSPGARIGAQLVNYCRGPMRVGGVPARTYGAAWARGRVLAILIAVATDRATLDGVQLQAASFSTTSFVQLIRVQDQRIAAELASQSPGNGSGKATTTTNPLAL